MLPKPTTHSEKYHLGLGSRLSKRSIKGLVAAGLVLATYTIYTLEPSFSYFSSPSHTRIDVAELDKILESHASSEVVAGVYEGEGLTSLGLEADESFHLGDTDLEKYKIDLEQFVLKVFPKKWQKDTLRSIQRHLGGGGIYSDQTSFSPIPHKIWQTAKEFDPDIHQSWKFQDGFDFQFMNDASADAWMKQQFDGSLLHWTWNRLPVGILRSDFLRYIFVLFEGGIYTDTDTNILKDFSHWGAGAEGHDASVGPPSLIVGIEADVGTREDWHQWWPRPLQICQWTIASAPLHPVLIDTVRRIYEKNVQLDAWRKKEGWTEKKLDEVLRDAVKNDELVGSVMEWTGPGVFTDATMRYLKAVHAVEWPAFKNIRIPQRYREAVVLPVTGFSPGVGMFGAGETYDDQAMVHHYFSGSWKHTQ